AVIDAEAATDVDVLELDAVLRELLDELDEARDRVGERRRLRELRADVEVDAGDLQALRAGGFAEQAARLLHRHAELVLLEARRDVRVRLRVDVGVDAQRDLRALAE